MKLLDCVESLSTNTLRKILQNHPPHTIRTEEGGTLSFLLDTNYLQSQFEKMNPNERRVLTAFLTRMEEVFYSSIQIAEMTKLPMDEVLVGLTLLRQKGIVFTHRRYFGEIFFFIPEDVKEQLFRLFVFSTNSVLRTYERFYQSNVFFEQLLGVLQYIRLNPLQLTQKGMIHKRQLMRLEAQLDKLQSIVTTLPIKTDDNLQYSNALALCLDFAVYYDLVGEYKEQLLIRAEGLAQWLEYTEGDRLELLWQYLCKRIAPFLSLEMTLLLNWITYIPMEHLVPWNSFLAFLERFHLDAKPYMNVLTIQLIQMLLSLGLISIVEEDGVWWIGKDTHIEGDSIIYLQANFQLLVPNATPVQKRWKIGEFADLLQNDQILIYEITQSSIERAIELGWDAIIILAFLETNTTGAPDNVRQMITSWASQYGKLRFLDVLVLECNDAETLTEIAQQERFRAYIVGQLSAKHLLIQRQSVQEFREVLTRAGFSPIKHIISFDEEDEQRIRSASPIIKGTIRAATKVENVYPEWEDTFPGIRTIPKTWINTYRSYHPTSLVDLLQRAKQHHLKLSVRLTNKSELQKIRPIELGRIGGDVILKFMQTQAEASTSDEWIAIKDIKEVAVHLPY